MLPDFESLDVRRLHLDAVELAQDLQELRPAGPRPSRPPGGPIASSSAAGAR